MGLDHVHGGHATAPVVEPHKEDQKETETSLLASLPHELLSKIRSYLARADLRNLGLTNRFFQRIAVSVSCEQARRLGWSGLSRFPDQFFYANCCMGQPPPRKASTYRPEQLEGLERKLGAEIYLRDLEKTLVAAGLPAPDDGKVLMSVKRWAYFYHQTGFVAEHNNQAIAISSLLLKQDRPTVNNAKTKAEIDLALCSAVLRGNQKAVQLFLTWGGNPQMESSGFPLLHHAINRGHEVIAQLLIDAGAPIRSQELNFAYYRKLESYEKWKEAAGQVQEVARPDLELLNHQLRTAFVHHDRNGLLQSLKLGADPNLLHYSVRVPTYLPSFTELLLNFGANPNLPNKDGQTPLHQVIARMAARRDNLLDASCTRTILSSLLKHGADPNLVDNEGHPPLHIAKRARKKVTDNIRWKVNVKKIALGITLGLIAVTASAVAAAAICLIVTGLATPVAPILMGVVVAGAVSIPSLGLFSMFAGLWDRVNDNDKEEHRLEKNLAQAISELERYGGVEQPSSAAPFH